MRQTSAEAYATIQASGLLSAARWAVYSYLYEHGPRTRNEIDRALAGDRPNPAFSRRLAEMGAMGVLVRVGERPCEVTGFNAELWDVTDKLPVKPPKRVTQKAALKRAIAEIKETLTAPTARVFPDFAIDRALAIAERAGRDAA